MRDLAELTAAFPSVFRLRRPAQDDVLAGLLRLAEERGELDGGFRYRFSRDADMLRSIAGVIEAEFRARPELHFALFVEAGRGPMWLAITGPGETRSLLEALEGTERTEGLPGGTEEQRRTDRQGLDSGY